MPDSGSRRVLVLRPDRIGDVILSLPAAEALKRSGASVHFLVREYTRPVVELCAAVDEVYTLESFAGGDAQSGRRSMVRWLREMQFDAAVHLQPRPALAWATFVAQVPLRIGTGYRYFSPLFNKRVYQHRRGTGRHEADLNLDLLEPLGIQGGPAHFSFRIPEQLVRAAERNGTLQPGRATVVLHPGSGGSARDWPAAHFAELAKLLTADGRTRVLLTGSQAESSLCGSIQSHADMKPENLAGRLTLKELAVVLQGASVVVANSTGPLHLAAALGTPVVGLYPPILECRPERWGPYGRPQDALMSRDENCTSCRTVEAGTACACMAAISVDRVLTAVQAKMTGKPAATFIKSS